ncbi:MAG: hypothetical protein MZU79_00495 [Anaerotruncus sp.]|nr:hypothetical protein [Anaerotruncus sp.]
MVPMLFQNSGPRRGPAAALRRANGRESLLRQKREIPGQPDRHERGFPRHRRGNGSQGLRGRGVRRRRPGR